MTSIASKRQIALSANLSRCRVCGSSLAKPVYVSQTDVSITSLCELLPGRTVVWHCHECSHTQTDELVDTAAYYDRDYRILLDSEEEDQVYQICGDRKIYRTEHQVETLLTKTRIPKDAHVMDYGCAKAATLRMLMSRRPDIQPYVFDVSDMYRGFWNRFVPTAQQAVLSTPPNWSNHFDLVVSMFALEHVSDPAAMVMAIASLLKPGGVFHVVVPNAFTNPADLVVADHINHFSEPSLRELFRACGLTVIDVDAAAHDGAFVVVAQKSIDKHDYEKPAANQSGQSEQIAELAAYWTHFAERVRKFELDHAAAPAAIYGSGFYGTFIATCLVNRNRIGCFLDRNPFRQGKSLLGAPILDPGSLPREIEVIYVGLNPRIARDAMTSLDCWSDRSLVSFFP